MKATVKVLRAAGRKRDIRSIQADPGEQGVLTLAKVGDSMELKLYDPNDSQMKLLIDPLWGGSHGRHARKSDAVAGAYGAMGT